MKHNEVTKNARWPQIKASFGEMDFVLLIKNSILVGFKRIKRSSFLQQSVKLLLEEIPSL